MLGVAETYRFDLGTLTMFHEEYEAAVAAFIRRNGVTRCPTACALPTQAAPAAADQAALQRYAALRNQSRRQHGRRTRPVVLGRQSLGRAR